MSKALLIDTTKCMGCRGCQVACKQWKNLPAADTILPEQVNSDQLSHKTLTHVCSHLQETTNGEQTGYFVKRQCMHCNVPSCVSACPAGALRKTAEGPVIYDASKCIGCMHCTLACPFSVPKFGWGKALALIQKCNLCFDRITAGMKPACVSTCPNDAITFGERDELIAEAERRIRRHPDKYVNHIYGREEAGGTSVLYLAGVPFEALGFPTDLGDKPLPAFQRKAIMIPRVAGGLGIIKEVKGQVREAIPRIGGGEGKMARGLRDAECGMQN